MYNQKQIIANTSLPFVTVSGTVKDENGNPLEGVNIYLKKDPLIGTTTNANGEFFFPDIIGVLDVVFLYQGNEVVMRADQVQNKVVTINALSSLPEAVVNGTKKRKIWPYVLGVSAIGILLMANSSTETAKPVTL